MLGTTLAAFDGTAERYDSIQIFLFCVLIACSGRGLHKGRRLIINSTVLHHRLAEQKIALGFKNRPGFNHPTRRRQNRNPVAAITTRFKFLEMIKQCLEQFGYLTEPV